MGDGKRERIRATTYMQMHVEVPLGNKHDLHKYAQNEEGFIYPSAHFQGRGTHALLLLGCKLQSCVGWSVGRRLRQMMLVITPSNGLVLVSKGMGGKRE